MNSNTLKKELKKYALAFADKRNLEVDKSHYSAVLFSHVKDCFHPESYENILNNENWKARTAKNHPKVPGKKEMQSSNSSDVLLMNIFCHPKIGKWAGVSKIIGFKPDKIEFGSPGAVRLRNEKADETEIDLSLTGCLCEAKLTEQDFTKKQAEKVEEYAELENIFHREALPRTVSDSDHADYDNYQIIRNLLAAIQHERKHILFCDERRPDLVRRYMETVSCLREVQHRMNCRVIFWQEIVSVCGDSLREWIEEKYGM